MSAKSPDTSAVSDDSMEMLDWEEETKPVEEDQKTLPDTASKLTNLNQELSAVRKDFEEYKATNDAKWGALESRKRQAEDSRVEGPAAKVSDPNYGLTGFSSPAHGAVDSFAELEKLLVSANELKNHVGCLAKTYGLLGSTIKFKDLPSPAPPSQEPPSSAPQSQDPLALKIADLEAALNSKTQKISEMEQEHEETVRLMSEQLDTVYSRLNPDPQALDPQEVRDAYIETLEERNRELQSIIQANLEEVELAQAQKKTDRVALVREKSELKDKLAMSETRLLHYENLKGLLKDSEKEVAVLKAQLKTEQEARQAYYEEMEKLRDVMWEQAEELKELRAQIPEI